MIDKLANRTALFFSHRGAVCEKDIAVIQYGCANAIHMIISTMVLFIIGLCYRDIASTAIILLLFYLNQTYGGGFHASTRIRCSSIMIAGLFIYLYLWRLFASDFILSIIAISSTICLWLMPIRLNHNKLYLNKRIKWCTTRMGIIILVEITASIICITGKLYLKPISYGLFASVVSRGIAIIERKSINKHKT